MSKSGWFRFYHDLPTQRKFRRLTPYEKLLVIAAWCLASRSPERGRLMVGKDLPATIDDLVDEAQLPASEVVKAVGTPDQPGTLCPCWLEWDGETLVVHDWGDWQYENPSDSPEATKERKRKQREREKSLSGHGGVTSESRESHETDTDSETDSDSRSKPPVTPPGEEKEGTTRTERTKAEYTPEFDAFWALYRRKDNKKGAFEKWTAILRKRTATVEELMGATERYMAYRKDQDPQYDLHARTFLNGQWRDHNCWRNIPGKTGAAGLGRPGGGQVSRPSNDVWAARREASGQ